jgi:RES domain-containing protein
MILYTIQKDSYKHVWPCRGALFAEGRWNRPGQWIIYTCATVSLAKLEILANSPLLPKNMFVMEIEVKPKAIIKYLKQGDLPSDWYKIPYAPQLAEITSDFLLREKEHILAVPSAQSYRENNFLINAGHPDFHDLCKLKNVEAEKFDDRLRW